MKLSQNRSPRVLLPRCHENPVPQRVAHRWLAGHEIPCLPRARHHRAGQREPQRGATVVVGKTQRAAHRIHFRFRFFVGRRSLHFLGHFQQRWITFIPKLFDPLLAGQFKQGAKEMFLQQRRPLFGRRLPPTGAQKNPQTSCLALLGADGAGGCQQPDTRRPTCRWCCGSWLPGCVSGDKRKDRISLGLHVASPRLQILPASTPSRTVL